MNKVLDFIRSRPTEVWIGLWTAIIAVVWGTGEVPAWTAAVTAVISWVVTFIASKSPALGPQ